jgi:hypothetical protein
MDSASDVRSVWSLECVECGRVSSENGRGWTARLTIDDEVVVYCPECDEREFSDSSPSSPNSGT